MDSGWQQNDGKTPAPIENIGATLPRARVVGGQFRRAVGIAQIDEAGAFDHAPMVKIEAGDDAAGQQ